MLISCPKNPCLTFSFPKIFAAFKSKEPLPQAGSMFLLILIQEKKPSPGQKPPKKA